MYVAIPAVMWFVMNMSYKMEAEQQHANEHLPFEDIQDIHWL